MATLLSLPAFAETLIIVPADENGSTAMSRDIAKGVVIPIMKSGKHKVIPYKNYRQAALAGGVKRQHFLKRPLWLNTLQSLAQPRASK